MARGQPPDAERELIEAFRQCGCVNEYLVQILPAGLWQAVPSSGRGRTIAGIVAHMQSLRRTFARAGGARPGPRLLDRKRVTPMEARRALRASSEILIRQFEGVFASKQARVKGMPRRAVNMIAYLMQHDAHHRGQICTIARDLGHRFTSEDVMRIWGWKKLPPQR